MKEARYGAVEHHGKSCLEPAGAITGPSWANGRWIRRWTSSSRKTIVAMSVNETEGYPDLSDRPSATVTKGPGP